MLSKQHRQSTYLLSGMWSSCLSGGVSYSLGEFASMQSILLHCKACLNGLSRANMTRRQTVLCLTLVSYTALSRVYNFAICAKKLVVKEKDCSLLQAYARLLASMTECQVMASKAAFH